MVPAVCGAPPAEREGCSGFGQEGRPQVLGQNGSSGVYLEKRHACVSDLGILIYKVGAPGQQAVEWAETSSRFPLQWLAWGGLGGLDDCLQGREGPGNGGT